MEAFNKIYGRIKSLKSSEVIGYLIALFFISTYYWAGWWMFFSFSFSLIGFFITLLGGLLPSDDKLDEVDLEYLNKISRRSLINSVIRISIVLCLLLDIFFRLYDDVSSLTIMLILIVLLFMIFIMNNDKNNISSDNAKKIRKQFNRKQYKIQQLEAKEKQKLKYQCDYAELIDKYGTLTSSVVILEESINDGVYIFENSKIAYICGREVAFKDILSCTFSDDCSIQKGSVKYESNTKTDTGSMVGRAVVGGVLLGGAGAVLGGATANKTTNTIVSKGVDRINHNYTVIINVNSLSDPVVRINTRRDGKITNEIIGIMNVIISRN